jgi:ornithine decarboxylase
LYDNAHSFLLGFRYNKCNGDRLFLKTLVDLGAGFDCASKQVIAEILSLGVCPDRIIFANTAKIAHHTNI